MKPHHNRYFPPFVVVSLFLILAAAVVVTASFWAFREIKTAAEARKHTFTAINRANVLLSELKDAEIGQRGYALTGDESFLKPYLAVRDNVNAHLKQLRQPALSSAAQNHLDALMPLVDAKIAQLAKAIALRRSNPMNDGLKIVSSKEGMRLMDSIRAEMSSFIQIQEVALTQYEAKLQSDLFRLFAIIAAATVFTLLFALWFAYLIYQQTQLRLKNLVHLETQHLLEIQEETNKQLQQVNIALAESQERLLVTLNSIGDAVIASDTQGRVTLLNPLSERLTGWTQAEAIGQPVEDILHIIDQETRLAIAIPIQQALATGEIQSMTNHTVLIARGGSECIIADSCAPIRNYLGNVVGAVLVFRDVSKDYAAKQVLRDNATRIQTILNTVADAIITFHAHNGLVETVNPAAEKMFGYSAEALIGQPFNLLIPELDPDQRKGSLEFYSASDQALAVGLGREVVGQRYDGSVFPLEIAVSEMLLDSQRYFIGILRDITIRRQAEEMLLKASTLQDAIFNSANFSSIATDAKGVIQIFNVGAERMLGYTASDVINKITPADISDPQEVIARAKALSTELETPITPGFEALVFKASRGIEDIYELTYIRKDGSHLPAVVSVTALRDAQNEIIGYLLIGTDNTERKRIEAERVSLFEALQDKNSELESTKSVAEKANLAKSDFLSSMSHELRTPLNAILGFAQLLEASKPAPSSTQKLRIDQIIKAGWYLLELINEILDLALIESGKVSLSQESVSLIDVLSECRDMMEPQAQRHGIKLSFLPLDNTWFVYADRTRLKQVLINLLSNAIKYNREDGTITVNCSANALAHLRISIKDSGSGLSSDQLAQLFQPFNRLGQETGTVEGTGIGLVVTKQLVELMKGKIGVDSTVGVGSEFWIELIRSAAPYLDVQDTMPTKRTLQAQENAALYTLLYVEDNPANLLLVEQIIEDRQDMRMLSASDGKRGITLARTQLPNVILMDINLPGISGMDALKILLHDPATTHIPVIALSANAMPHDIEKGLKAGFYRYLTKPIKIDEFTDALNEALESSELELIKTNETGQLL